MHATAGALGIFCVAISSLAPLACVTVSVLEIRDLVKRYGALTALAGVSLDNVWSSSAAVSFTPGIAAEGHVAEASSYRFFNTVAASSASPSGAISGLVIQGLAPNTTYYFRAAALNQDFRPNYTAAQSSVTLALPLSPMGPGIEYTLLQSETAPEPRPLTITTDNGSFVESMRVQLFSSPQHVAAAPQFGAATYLQPSTIMQGRLIRIGFESSW